MFVVLTGPSCAGKNTCIDQLLSLRAYLRHAISCTTRAPREGEIEGVHYYFKKMVDFRKMMSQGEFVEWANYNGNLYGTPRSELDRIQSSGFMPILDVECDGARKLREDFPNKKGYVSQHLSIFLYPPSVEELERRFKARGTENSVEMLKRLKKAKEEMLRAGEFDHILINKDLDTTAQELLRLIDGVRSESKKVSFQRRTLQSLDAQVGSRL